MKLDEEYGHDRDNSFLTDDEENQADLVCDDEDDDEDDDDDSESGKYQTRSKSPSTSQTDINNATWPRSYGESMNMFTGGGVSPPRIVSKIGKSVSFLFKNNQGSDVDESSVSKSLLSDTSLDREEVPFSTHAVKVTSSSQFSLFHNLSEGLAPKQQRQCSFCQSVLNGINVLCGIGLLATPYALKEGGWFSLLILLFYAVIACYTGILMKRCLESSPSIRTYPDIGQAAFGYTGRLAISVILYVELYAACVEYIIMTSDNLSRLFPNSYLIIGGLSLDPRQIFMVVATIVALPTVWLRDLSLLSYLSVGGVVSSVLVVLCLLWVGVVDEVGFHPTGRALDLTNISVAIGIYGFGYSGHAVFPNIYSSMKEPSKFPLVLVISFTFCWFLYTGVAVCSYLMFGDSVESQITLTMPKQFAASKIAVWTAVVTPMSKYALTITPIVLSLEELLPSARFGVSVLIKTTLVISTLVVALTIPFFAILAALCGSILTMLATLIFPCACYLSIRKGTLRNLQIGISVFIIIVGVVSGCCGTYSSIARLAEELTV